MLPFLLSLVLSLVFMKPIIRYPKGQVIPSTPIGKIAEGVRQAYCQYLNNPISNAIPENSPAGWLRRGLKDAAGCNPPAPPPPGAPVFPGGGACPGAQYQVLVSGTYEQRLSGNNWESRSFSVGSGSLPGVIASLRYEDNAGTRVWFARVNANSERQGGNEVVLFNHPANLDNVRRSLAVTPQIQRANQNEPDVCPNPAPPYPIPPNRDSPNAPAPYSFPSVIIIPVTPTVNIPVSIRPTITINGGINFRVADSIDVNINVDGIDIYINPKINLDLFPDAPDPGFNLPPGFPDPPTGNNGSEGVDSPEDDACLEALDGIDDLRELLEELKDCACPNDPPPQITEQVIQVANNGSLAVPVNCLAVKVELVDAPANPKIEWGGGNAPDVYYAGWTSFGRFNGQGERTPIDYLSKVFFPPDGANRFTWTCRQFYTARITFLLKTPTS